VWPGTRYLVTRRCHDRSFLMVPDDKREALKQLIGYALAYCLEKYGLLLHEAVFMSNHYHLVVTDVHGQLPAFKGLFNALVARSVNALRGRSDSFWSGDPPCDVTLESDERLVDRMAYTLANPAQAELVKWGRRWPGFTTWHLDFGDKLKFRRPKTFFDPDNHRHPATAELTLVRPAAYPKLTDAELREHVRVTTRAREREKHKQMKAANRRFLGEKAVVQQRWDRSPHRPEDRFGRRPKVSDANKWVRIAALQRNKSWEANYAAARDAFRDGDRDVEFPFGTWALQRWAGVKVATAPP
jgi:REP element-mobilizing transposase RayT